MMLVLTIVVTAIVVGAVAALVSSRIVRGAVTQAIGGRAGADPVDEHHRLLGEATKQAVAATSRADLLRLSLDALTSGVVVTDHAGKTLVRNRLANDVATRSFERTLVDATVSELLALAVQGRGSEREVDVFGPPQRHLVVHAVPITSGAEVIGALAVIDDVTDQRRIENTRRDFIANLSHELRTPIGAVSLLTEMLVDEGDVDNRSQLTTRMLIETERMTETIDDLLELSRIESSAEDYDDVVIVRDLLDEAVERTRVLAEAAGVTVGALAPNEPIVLTGNRAQLITALVNLVENAVKYSSVGDSVSVRARVDDGAVALVVQDTGRGIPARDIDRIFERFYRVDRSRNATTGGTGIGLSIVRHVALNHGGDVAVESFEGDGSTFTMALPATTSATTTATAILPAPEPDPERKTADEVG